MRFKETIQLLEREASEARSKLREAAQARRDADTNITDAVRSIISAELTRIYGPVVDHLHQESTAAQKRLEDARNAAALAGEGAPAPLGTIYRRWERTGRPYDDSRRWFDTNERAVVESITPDSQHPDNTRDHAKIGDYVLRLLKKNGERSKKYIRLTGSWNLSSNPIPHGWYVDGETPAEPTKS